MSDASYAPRLGGCPACDAAPLAQRLADRAEALAPNRLILSLPDAHCALCITQIEGALMAHPGVRAARVNLTLRRVTVNAPGLTAADLVPVLTRAGHQAHELDPDALAQSAGDRAGRDLLMRIGVSGFAMMNIMILSVAVWSGAEAATRDLFHWISGAIALPTVVFAGQPFFASAWRSLKAGRLGMDVPISLALILASADATGTDPDGPFKTSHRVIADHLRSTVFLMADAVIAAKAGQKTPDGYYNMERMLKRVLSGKGEVLLCGTCMDARGLSEADMMEGVRRSTMDELAATTIAADKVLVF